MIAAPSLRRNGGAFVHCRPWWCGLLALLTSACSSGPEYDVLLRGGTVVDGSGAPGVVADVGVTGGHVAAVGDLGKARGIDELDVAGLVVAPGFVNLHSHGRISELPQATNLIAQGVTTVILNADGGGPLDVGRQLSEAEGAGLAINVGANVGFNSAWAEVNGPDDRRPSPADLEAMRDLLERGLEAGAWGVSAGLDYKPAYYARTDEVERVLRGMERWRTVFTNHDRVTPESGFSSLAGMRETLAIGEAVGLAPLITHMKVQGHEQGRADEILADMDAATERGVFNAADAYPYLAGQTSLAALIVPGWAQEGGSDAMRARFADPSLRARIVAEANEALDARFGGPSGVYLPETERELTEVMTELGASSGGDAVVRLLENGSPGAILRFGSEDDLERILTHPTTAIACDCDASAGGPGHPRAFGTFPRVLGRYVRERGVLTLEDAVRKMSALPAATIGLVDRGRVAPGFAADLVVLDADRVIDRSTYADPTAPPEGVLHVMVNGSWALRDGAPTGTQAGRALRRTVHMPAHPMLSGASSVSLEGALDPDGRIELEVTGDAARGSAGGSFEIETPDVQVTSSAIGGITTYRGWAAVVGRARIDGAEVPITILLDGAGGAEETTVVVLVEGRERLRARVLAGMR